MSKKATEFQRKAMSRMYRGKEIFKPLNTGWIDENVACVREWVANIFFYRSAFVSLQEMTNASAAVTADSSRIKFNRLILIPFF